MKPLHIVQIGYDDSVFAPNAPSDTRLRQRLYAELLIEKRPGSRMTVVVLTMRPDLQPLSDGPVRFVPVGGRGGGRVLGLFRQLIVLSAEQKIDVIATQTIFTDAWVALAVGRWIGAKVVGQIHFDIFSPFAQVENSGDAFQDRCRMAIALKLLRYLDVVRVTGQRLQRDIPARGLHHKVVLVPMPASIPASPPPSRLVADGCKRVVLFVGRLVEQKNLPRWLRVAHQINLQEPDVEFVWAGDGPLREELLTLASQLGLKDRLRWLGPVPYEQLPDLYGQATIFLLTSDYEGLPRVILEAGLQGLPVVATRIMGVEDIIADGETGFLHDSNDEVSLADSALRLLRAPELCARVGALAQVRVHSNFDFRHWAEQWVNLLISIAEENRDFASS